jgi:hypothetical protein
MCALLLRFSLYVQVSVAWPGAIAPHRVAIVGESLFVHCQVCVCVRECAPRTPQTVMAAFVCSSLTELWHPLYPSTHAR